MLTDSDVKQDDAPLIRGMFWTAADTSYFMNCHICASREVELIHVHYNRPDLVQHECPMCGSRVGPPGPNVNCGICIIEFNLEG